ncbi:efflux transporter outer membrane subunit [Acidovorax sp. GBBC 1281]|uniref:efflux transporter outer membrane subunit n=1 Tax=Acidovorax sp. GBBC 1281 TaxID=2940492 RepID=UPI00234A67F0|nr:efflux transporter outer membrane subunit [Acidovorax sp. GBBC 1281]WCM99693.1 efflux transporter outer membrane subunit [Acidovorax sp. GBBC 1281]
MISLPAHPVRSGLSLACAALALLVGGCSLTPPFERPVPWVPATFIADPAGRGMASEAATAELSQDERRFLQSFSPARDLAPMVARALAHNADFRLAALKVEQARAQYGIEDSARLPQVGLQVQRDRQRFGSDALQARYGQDQAYASVGISDFEIDFFGKMKALSEAARQRYLASAHGQQAARGALIAEVLRAYSRKLAAAQATEQMAAIDSDSAALLSIARRQHEVGTISADELDAQRTQADRIHVRALQAADDDAAALRALQLLIGYSTGRAEGDIDGLLPRGAPVAALRNLDSQVLLQRPDIQQAEAELRAGNADIGAARAAFFPSIRLSTSVGVASDSLSGLFNSGSRLWTFTPQLVLPIFDHGRNIAGLQLAEVRQQAGIAEYEKAVQSAFREVADALGRQATLAASETHARDNAMRERARIQRLAARTAQGLQNRSTLLSERVRASQSELDHLGIARDLVLNRIALFSAFYGVQLPSSL